MLLAGLSAAALACGQTTHVTLALWALDRVSDPELSAFVRDPELRAALVSGVMFPDGGYSPVVNHPYGEVAHWEPFHLAYLETLAPRGPAFAGDDRKRVAFLLGLAAHGLADQGYDAAYLTRSATKDAAAPRLDSADTETDVAFAAEAGGVPIEPRWVPYEDLIPVFAAAGVEVDVATMESGMASLDIALLFVDRAAQDPARVDTARANWPWATAHLFDRAVPGSPELLADAVAAYWEILWDRLHGRPIDDRPILAVWPAHDAAETGEDALVSVVFSRALTEASVEAPGQVAVAAGGDRPVEAWMFYGDRTNVLNVRPLEAWAPDREHDLVVRAGARSFDGWESAEDLVGSFSTAPPPAEDRADRPAPRGCAQAPGPGSAALLLPLLRRRRGARALRGPSAPPAR